MGILNILRVGQFGIVKDVPSHELHPSAWSDGNNVAFTDKLVKKMPGYTQTYDSSNGVTSLYGLFFHRILQKGYWIGCGLTAVHGWESSVNANITRASGAYNATPSQRWTGGNFNGVLVLNNSVDAPQVWSAGELTTPVKLIDLPNWPANVTAKVVRPFGNYLVALHIDKTGASGANFPEMIKWSHPADPGSVPTSWDESDATKDAGEFVLMEGGDHLIDCLPMGNLNILYRETSTYAMRNVGGIVVFGFNNLFRESGILAEDCARSFMGKHFVVTRDDIIVHDGSTITSVVDARMRNWFFGQLSTTNFYMSFVLPYYERKEMWICAPFAGAGQINSALVWNWRDNTWTVRDLPGIRASISVLPQKLVTADNWDSETALNWNSDSDDWQGNSVAREQIRFAILDAAEPTIIEVDNNTFQASGVNYTSFIERTGFCTVGFDETGNPIKDREKIKYLLSLRPRFKAVAGTEIQIYVGAHEYEIDNPTYKDPVTFTVGTTKAINPFVSGRFLAFKFQESGDATWELEGFELELQTLGRF